MTCACVCHSNGAYPPPCPAPGGCGPHDDQPEHRCERGKRCSARERETDQHDAPYVGAPADRALCSACERRVVDALDDVTTLWGPLEQAVRDRSVGEQRHRVSGSSPASHRSPLNLTAQTLLDEAHGLLIRWEEVVRDVARLIPPEDGSRYVQVARAAETLAAWLPVWLSAGPHDFNLDRTTTLTQTGPEAASALLDWREAARVVPGVDPKAPKAVRRYQQRCPACGVRAITHRAGDDLMQCQNCGATQEYLPTLPTEADYREGAA